MRTAVVVVTLGERPWFPYAVYWVDHFCNRFGFDLIVCRQPLIDIKASNFQNFGRCQKLGIRNLFDQYDYILQVDDTCLISPLIENIIDLVPEGAIGCYVEGKDQRRYARYQSAHKVAYARTEPLPLERFDNNGMAFYSKHHAPLFDPHVIPWDVILTDPMFPTGGYLSHRADVLGYPLHDLGAKYNCSGSIIKKLDTLKTDQIFVFHLTSIFNTTQRVQYARKLHRIFTDQCRALP